MTALVPFLVVGIAEDDTVGAGKNVVAGASLNIVKVGGGSASIYADEAGTTPISLPTTLDSSGQKMIFIAAGAYDVVIGGVSRRQDIIGAASAPIVVDTFADLATTSAARAGMVVYVKQHTSGGVLGGHYIDTAGTVTEDGWTVINNTITAGRHWKKIDGALRTAGANYKHASDYATLGSNFLPLVSTFSRTNFDAGSTHAAGTVGTLSASFTQVPIYSYCILVIDITTTTSGYVNVLVGADYILDDSPSGYYFSTVPIYADGIENNRILSSTTYSFMIGLNANASDITITTDTAWAGTINSVSLKIVDPIKHSVSGQASDDALATNPIGIKMTGFNRNDMAFGDRFTLGAFQYDGLALTPAHNFAAGAKAMASTQHGDENTAVGTFALQYNEGSNNTAVGYSALKRSTKGQENTAVGYKSAASGTTAARNCSFGFWAGGLNLTGSDLTMVGWYAGRNCRSDGLDTFVGSRAGLKQLGGANNTYFGSYAGYGSSNGAGDSSDNNQVSVGGQSWAYGDNSYTVGAFSRVGTLAAPAVNSGAIGTNVGVFISNATKIGNAQTSTTLSGRLASRITFASIGDAAGVAYTAAQFFSGFIVRFSTSSPFTDTTPAASEIIAMIGGAENLTGYDLYIRNLSSHTLTLAAGDSVILDGAITIPSNKVRLLKIRVEGAAVGVYQMALMDA